MEAAHLSETPELPPISLASEDSSQRQEHASSLPAQMPETGSLVHIPGLNGVNDSAMQPLDSPDVECHDTNTTVLNGSQVSSPPVEPETSLAVIVNHAPAGIDGLPVDSVPILQERQEQESPQGLALAQQISNDEWQYQYMQCLKYPYIHHFNFLGDGVLRPNATPPAVSLMVSVSGAKAGFAKVDESGETNPHGYAVMRNAMSLVDSVIYHGSPEDLELRGESLREAVTGVCDKFYSEHGTWWIDRFDEEDDRPLVDRMDVLTYPLESLPVNGWFQNAFVMDREELNTLSHDTARWEERQRQDSLKYRRKNKPQGSPLRQMMTLENLDASIVKKSEEPGAATSSEISNGAKKFDSGWTVDLDEFLGKCDDWSDEVDDDYHAAHAEKDEGSPIEGSVPSDDQAEMIDDSEGKKQSAPVELATSVPDSDIASVDNTLQDSIISENEGADDQNTGPIENFALQPAGQSDAIHGPSLKKDVAANVVEHSMDGLSEEELQAEDREIYGDSTFASPGLEVLLQQLHDSQLITRDDGDCAASQSSEEDEDREYFAPASDSEPAFQGGTFSLPIREKKATKVEDPLIASATGIDFGSSPVSSISFDLPIRGKVALPVDLPTEKALNLSAESHSHVDAPASASKDGTFNSSSIKSFGSSLPKILPNQEDNDKTEDDQQISEISDKTLICTLVPLRPRRYRTRRLTDSSAELLETSLGACSAAGTSKNGTETTTTQNEVYLSHSNQHPGIDRSQSFPNLEQLAPEREPLRNTQRWSTLPSCLGLEKASIDAAPNANLRFKLDKLDPIFEEDEVEGDTGMCSEGDENWSVISPVCSPYKRPASNTPNRMMRKSNALELLEDVEDGDFIEEAEMLSEVDDHSTTSRHAGEPFCYALQNWCAIFPNDVGIDIDQPPFVVGVDDVPFIGGAPTSIGGSSTTVDSQLSSALKLSSISTQDTRATTPTIESPKTVKDVMFIPTRPSESKLDEIKAGLNAQLSRSKASSKKTKVKQSIKTFFRKSLETFAVMGNPIF